jgi:hypothetical protein
MFKVFLFLVNTSVKIYSLRLVTANILNLICNVILSEARMKLILFLPSHMLLSENVTPETI